MPNLIEGKYKNLYGGVSRQPTQVRLPNQVENQTNALSSVQSGGFEKRPPTQHIAALTNLDTTKNYKVHPMDRDATTKDFLFIECDTANPNIFVYNTVDGTARTVTIGDTVHSHLINATALDSTVSSGVVQVDGADFTEKLAWASSETEMVWTWDLSDAVTVRFQIEGSADGLTGWTILQNAAAAPASGLGGAATGTFTTEINKTGAGDHNYVRIKVTTTAAKNTDTLSIRAAFADLTYLLDVDPEELQVTSVADYTFICNTLVNTLKEDKALNDIDKAITATYQSWDNTTGGDDLLSNVTPSAATFSNIYKIQGEDIDGFGTFYVDVTHTGPYTLTCVAVALNETVILDGITYTAKNAEDVSANEFDRSGTDAATATSLAKCINDTTNGSGTTYDAAVASNVVTITRVDNEPEGLPPPTGTAIGATITLAGGTYQFKEIVDPSKSNVIANSTMPHQLVRNALTGNYTYSAASWDNREAGNDVVNPDPGFIGQPISDVLFFRNRLVLLSNETVYCSQTGDVFNMYAGKATEIVASDPIERAATANTINYLVHGTVYRKLLFLTSFNNQFELESGNNPFTEEFAKLDQSTSYRASRLSKPAPMGDILYFSSSTEGSAVLYEYYYQESSLSNTATDISRHIRGYIGNDVLTIVADAAEQTLFVLTSAEQNSLFVYRTFFEGTQKYQSAWSKYTFGATESDAFIHGMAIFDSNLYLAIERDDGVIYLERMAIEREDLATGMPYMPHIDQRDQVAATYDSTHEVTHWVTPWTHADDAQVCIGGDATINKGAWPTPLYPDSYTLKCVSVAADDTVTVGGKVFTGKAAEDLTAREFDRSGTDAATATSLAACINDTTDGIGTDYQAYVTWPGQATNDGTVLVVPLDGPDNLTMAAPTASATITVTKKDIVIAVREDYSSATTDYVGRDYTMTVEMSKIYPSEPSSEGDSAVTTGRLQLMDLTTSYTNTGYFKIKLTPDGGRTTRVYTFEGKLLGGGVQIDGVTIAASGTFGHSKVLSNAETTKIEYENATPLPCVISSVQWRGFFNEVGRSG